MVWITGKVPLECRATLSISSRVCSNRSPSARDAFSLRRNLHIPICYSGSLSASSLMGYYFIDEIGCVDAPAFGDILVLDGSLLCQYLVSDLLPTLAQVGSSAHHKLVSQHSHSKVIGHVAVVLVAHHLGSHIAGSATGIMSVVLLPLSRYSQVGNSEVPVRFHH